MKKWGVLIGTSISNILTTLDFTIVNTSLVPIQKSLSATLAELQWFIAAFGIPFCVMLVICGRLADLYGRRMVFFIGIGGFGLASLAAGLSTTSIELIISRFFQGVFGATIFPCAIALTTEAFPLQERRQALGVYYGMTGLGLALGPVVGGIITEALNWHWIFFINVPLILISYLICIPLLKESKLKEKGKIDWKGLALMLIGLTALVSWITDGPTIGWISWLSLALLIIAAAFLWLYTLHEKRTQEPILPFDLFRNRGFQLGLITSMACNSCMWAVVFLAPLYLQGILDYTPAAAGSLLLIMTAMSIASPTLGGYIFEKKGKRMIFRAIFSLLSLGYVLMIAFSAFNFLPLLILSLLGIGLGWGIGRGVNSLLILSDHDTTAHTGMLMGASATLQNLFGVIILSISGTLLRLVERWRFDNLLSQVKLHLTESEENTMHSLGDPTTAKQMLADIGVPNPDLILTFFKDAFLLGFEASMLFLLLFTLLIGAFVFTRLKKRSV